MNHQSGPDDCVDALISDFLLGECTPDQEFNIVAHLDRCPRCQEAMQRAAGTKQQWSEASQFLTAGEFDVCATGEFSKGRQLQTTDAEAVQRLLDSLPPISDRSKPDCVGILGGHFEIKSVIGAGSMGVVLRANDPSLARDVAIKVLSSPLAASKTAQQRFAREARAVAAVTHPNVIAIHSVSVHHELPFLVMPLVDGESLQKQIDREGPLPLERLLEIGIQISRALAAAHAAGLIHRDVKPANILIQRSSRDAILMDFGLARTVDDSSITQTNVIVGTPDYMSPEQASGKELQPSSDLFSLGSVLYAMGTGGPPFKSDSAIGVLRCVSDDEPQPMQQRNADTPVWLQQKVAHLMQKSPGERPESAATVARQLESFLSHLRDPQRVPLPEVFDSSGSSANHQSEDFANGSYSKRPTAVAAAVVAALIVGGFFGVSFLSKKERVPSQVRSTMNPDKTVDASETINADEKIVTDDSPSGSPSSESANVKPKRAPQSTASLYRQHLVVGSPMPKLPLLYRRGAAGELEQPNKLNVMCFWNSENPRSFYALRLWHQIQQNWDDASFVCVSQQSDEAEALKIFDIVQGKKKKFENSAPLIAAVVENEPGWLSGIAQSALPLSCVSDQQGNLMWVGPPEGLELALDSIDAENPDLDAARKRAQQNRQHALAFDDAVSRFDWAAATELLPKVRKLDPLAAGRFDLIGFETRLAENDLEPAFEMARRMHATYGGQPELIGRLARRLTDKCFQRLFDDGAIPKLWYDAVQELATDAVNLTLERDATALAILARSNYLRGDLDKAIMVQQQAIGCCDPSESRSLTEQESFYRQVISAGN